MKQRHCSYILSQQHLVAIVPRCKVNITCFLANEVFKRSVEQNSCLCRRNESPISVEIPFYRGISAGFKLFRSHLGSWVRMCAHRHGLHSRSCGPSFLIREQDPLCIFLSVRLLARGRPTRVFFWWGHPALEVTAYKWRSWVLQNRLC